jgi:peptidoglycan/LPS O-acetylase OafA/YrhL
LGLFAGSSRLKSAAYLIAAMVLMLLVGKTIVLYFPIWLLGAVVSQLPPVPWLAQRWLRQIATVASFILFVCLMCSGHLGSVKHALGGSLLIADYLTGIGFALFMYVVLHQRAPAKPGWYAFLAGQLSGFSYSLYALHMPLLVFLRATVVGDEPWRVTSGRLLLSAALAVLVTCYAWCISRLTEANTDIARQFVIRILSLTARR